MTWEFYFFLFPKVEKNWNINNILKLNFFVLIQITTSNYNYLSKNKKKKK